MASSESGDLVEQYQRGATLVALAAEVGCHPVTVRRRLLAAGVQLRSSRTVERRDPQWWQDQIASGRSVADLAAELGLTSGTVRRRLRAAGIPLSAPNPTFVEWLRMRVYPNGDCLRWIGYRLPGSGYGQGWWKGRKVLAHRLAWEQLIGPIPDDCELTRTAGCPHPDCVRVQHLQCLPPRQRIQEKVEAGAFAHGDQHWNAKLGEDEARAILCSQGPAEKVAARYNVTPQTVRAIRVGRSWRHLQR